MTLVKMRLLLKVLKYNKHLKQLDNKKVNFYYLKAK
jgi:hypothetical protein